MLPIGCNDRNQPRPIVLLFTEFYVPGYRAGGPIRSLANLVSELKNEFDFRIVTSDRDLGKRNAYPGIRANEWQGLDGAQVLYLSPGPQRWWRIARLLLAGDCHMIYLNSAFSRAFSMLPTWLKFLGVARRIPVLLAPRGEFSPGALAIHPHRKRFYLAIQNFLNSYRQVVWQASNRYEEANILATISRRRRVVVVGPVSQIKVFVSSDMCVAALHTASLPMAPIPTKTPGSLNLVFVSRISRMKNLSGALEILAGVQGAVHFNIYGPMEDPIIWAECQRLIDALPPNVKACYCGELTHDQVADVLSKHHLFFLPTCGENFGHVILEALLAGCPVLISDQTPWRNLQAKGVGWDLPLDSVTPFQQAIHECVAMDDMEFRKVSKQARLFGSAAIKTSDTAAQNREMFWGMLNLSNKLDRRTKPTQEAINEGIKAQR
jgi:glycosyltransferase involved in cell wall biosynthesis